MPTVMNPHHVPHHHIAFRTTPQKICIAIGIALIIVGFMGVILPGMLAMHLSMVHNFIHIASGAVALWCGYSTSNRSILFCIFFGAVYAFLGVIGFILGEPGYPGVGHMEADQNLFRILPNVLELGTIDHIVHLLIGAFLLFTAYTFRKDRQVEKISRLGELNRRSTLGSSDYEKKL